MKTRIPTPSAETPSGLRGSRPSAESELTPVVIFDDRRVVRDLLERALRTGSPERFAVVGHATDSSDVTRLLAGRRARVLVLRQEASDWLEVIGRFRRAWPRCSILVVTERPELDLVGEVASAGADGLVTSDMGADALLDAIAALAVGHSAFSPRAVFHLHARNSACRAAIANGEPMPTFWESLRPVEREALLAYATSGTISDAASSLGRSRLTTRNQVDSARDKLGAANRVQAIWFALRSGAIEVELDQATTQRIDRAA